MLVIQHSQIVSVCWRQHWSILAQKMDSEQDTAVSGLSLSDLLGTELLGFALDDVDLSLSGTGTGFRSSGTPADSHVHLL